jgi:hypothetical protein
VFVLVRVTVLTSDEKFAIFGRNVPPNFSAVTQESVNHSDSNK